jgi:large subunit ribosomal protein L18
MKKDKYKVIKRSVRRKRIRAKISGDSVRPRLSVFRSNSGMYLQLIDDKSGKTLASADSQEIKEQIKSDERSGKIAVAFELGKLVAQRAKEKKIGSAVFDRGGYRYHGRVKAAAEGARDGGLFI